MGGPLKFRKLALKSELAIFRRIIDMRMLMIVLTAVASVLVSGWAEAGGVEDPGRQAGWRIPA